MATLPKAINGNLLSAASITNLLMLGSALIGGWMFISDRFDVQTADIAELRAAIGTEEQRGISIYRWINDHRDVNARLVRIETLLTMPRAGAPVSYPPVPSADPMGRRGPDIWVRPSIERADNHGGAP